MQVPSPSQRPTEYLALLLAAVLAVIDWWVPVDPELQARLGSLVLLLIPLVTWLVSRQHRAKGQVQTWEQEH